MPKLLLISFFLFTIPAAAAAAGVASNDLLITRPGEKSAIIRYYVHGASGGPSQGIYEVAKASVTDSSPTQFGQLSVLDCTITADYDENSTELGHVQGMMMSADRRERAMAMVVNVVFTAGPYNGSSLSVLGRNPLEITTGRVLPIAGGSGTFLMARGYVLENTYSFDPVENSFVMNNTAYVYYGDYTSVRGS
ncbi:dirigent protein 22-like [Andrographis paniculata]|uniref:dirigent protein 22-like n=1 Tax=Andrographis paniculata TaxID=175694 RepID=UPI0021E8DAA2|nr:dirigent protein 22-like [Andrographis paniculata]